MDYGYDATLLGWSPHLGNPRGTARYSCFLCTVLLQHRDGKRAAGSGRWFLAGCCQNRESRMQWPGVHGLAVCQSIQHQTTHSPAVDAGTFRLH